MAKVQFSNGEVEKLPLVTLVYCYQFLDMKGKILHVWMDAETKEKRIFAGKSGAKPDMMFTFPCPSPDSVLFNRKQYIGLWKDQDDLIVWEARHLEEKGRHQAFLNEKEGEKKGRINQAVSVIREAYQLQGTFQKRSRFLIWLVDELNK